MGVTVALKPVTTIFNDSKGKYLYYGGSGTGDASGDPLKFELYGTPANDEGYLSLDSFNIACSAVTKFTLAVIPGGPLDDPGLVGVNAYLFLDNGVVSVDDYDAGYKIYTNQFNRSYHLGHFNGQNLNAWGSCQCGNVNLATYIFMLRARLIYRTW